MPIVRSAVLCGSHSGDLVPDLRGPVPESGDTEIPDTHVSYCDGQPDPSIPVIKATQRSGGRRTQNTLLRTAEHQSIQNNLQKPINYRHTQGKSCRMNRSTLRQSYNHATLHQVALIMQEKITFSYYHDFVWVESH